MIGCESRGRFRRRECGWCPRCSVRIIFCFLDLVTWKRWNVLPLLVEYLHYLTKTINEASKQNTVGIHLPPKLELAACAKELPAGPACAMGNATALRRRGDCGALRGRRTSRRASDAGEVHAPTRPRAVGQVGAEVRACSHTQREEAPSAVGRAKAEGACRGARLAEV